MKLSKALYKSRHNMAIAATLLLIVTLLSGCDEPDELPAFTHPIPDNSIELVAVGDIMLGGTAEEIMLREGFSYPFTQIQPLLSDADIVIGNLEGPLTTLCQSPLEDGDKEYLFRSLPDGVAPALKRAGFNLLNLANNHILDYGVEGMQQTMQSLKRYKIRYVGAGKNRQQARRGTIMQTRSGSVGFLSYSLTFPESFWATEDRPGTAFGHKEQIQQDITRLKSQADVVVVSFHWGREKTTELRPYQPDLGRAAIDAGASLVIGHHPHVLQAFERYRNGLIMYSLGNFVFGSYSPDAQYSVIARVILHQQAFHSIEITPINVLNTEVVFQPRLLPENEAKAVIEHINRLSAPSNTRFDHVNQRGYLHVEQKNLQSLARNN